MVLGASACKFEIPVRVHKQPLHVWSVYVHKCLCIRIVRNVWSVDRTSEFHSSISVLVCGSGYL